MAHRIEIADPAGDYIGSEYLGAEENQYWNALRVIRRKTDLMSKNIP